MEGTLLPEPPPVRHRSPPRSITPQADRLLYGGVFRVLIPDNTKVIVDLADSLQPRLNQGFLEYAQARGFHIDTARVRRAQDKARVERAVQSVRDDCFAGERIQDLEHVTGGVVKELKKHGTLTTRRAIRTFRWSASRIRSG
jgi:transposase